LTEVCAATATGSYVRLAKARPDAPAPLARTIERALAPVPEKRFDDGAAFAAALAALPAALAASRSRSLTVAAAVAAVVLAAGAGLAFSRGAGPPPAAPVSSPVVPSTKPTTVAPDDRPPLDDPEHPLSTYRRQRGWAKAHAGDPRGVELARRLAVRTKKPLASHALAPRPKCFWVGPTTLLVATQEKGGPYVIDLDARAPHPVRIASFPVTPGLFSGALLRREGSVRWVVGGIGRVYVVEGNPGDPGTLTSREAFVVPPDAEPAASRTPQQRIMAVAITPDGKTVAAGGDWRDVFILDLDHSERAPRRLRPTGGGTIQSLAFASGRLLASNSNISDEQTDQSLCVFDLATGKLERGVPLQTSVGAIAFAPDERFAFGLDDGAIKVERLDGREEICLKWPIGEWTGLSAIKGLAFIAGGERLVAATGEEGRMRGARLFIRSSRSEDEPPRLLADDLDAMVSLDLSEDGLLLATGAYGGLLEVRAMPD
jgi:hypothetical protein